MEYQPKIGSLEAMRIKELEDKVLDLESKLYDIEQRIGEEGSLEYEKLEKEKEGLESELSGYLQKFGEMEDKIASLEKEVSFYKEWYDLQDPKVLENFVGLEKSFQELKAYREKRGQGYTIYRKLGSEILSKVLFFGYAFPEIKRKKEQSSMCYDLRRLANLEYSFYGQDRSDTIIQKSPQYTLFLKRRVFPKEIEEQLEQEKTG